MKSHQELAAIIRPLRHRIPASEIAMVSVREAQGEMRELFFVAVFWEAFPGIPLATLKHASTWHGLNRHGMSDEEFDALLSPWLAVDAEAV